MQFVTERQGLGSAWGVGAVPDGRAPTTARQPFAPEDHAARTYCYAIWQIFHGNNMAGCDDRMWVSWLFEKRSQLWLTS